jgi:hypothetical protein
MSDEQTEQLDNSDFGRPGIEKAAGYTPMQMANPDPPAEPAIDPDSELAKHFNRPPPPEPIHRDYHDVQTGEATPENQTLELERAARDISEARAAEKLELQSQSNADLHAALDYLQQSEEALRAATTPVTSTVGEVDHTGRVQTEQQPPPNDFTPQIDPESLPPPQIDPELYQALQSPAVRQVFEQTAQQFEETKAAYQNQLANAALTATASFMAAFPELNGLQPEQLQGAVAYINKTNPARAQEIARQYDRVSHLVQKKT